MHSRRYVVCYDIPDDRRRHRVSHLLTGFGVRVQWSFFECVLNDLEVRRMIAALDRTIHAREDNVLVLQCAAAGWPLHAKLAAYTDQRRDFWID